MNWGRSIVLAFILFAALVITMVTISMKQDVNLVASNYYEEEIAYQDQIDRLNNFKALDEKPTIQLKDGLIELWFPASVTEGMENAVIHFFRPSDRHSDRKIKVTLNAQNKQLFSTADFSKGLWKTKLSWKNGQLEFFSEQRIVL